MSVASRNPFSLLEDDASRPSSPNSQAVAAPPAPAPTRGNQRPRGGPASRGGRYYQRGGKPSAPKDSEGDAAPAEEDAPRKRFDGEGRGRGRGRGRGDRGRGGGGGGRGGGRPFDRHSATGKTDSDKKFHQGWGGDEGNSELKAEDAGATDAAAEATGAPADDSGWGPATTDTWGAGDVPPQDDNLPPAAAAAEGDKSGEGRRGRDREPEEEDNTLTFDQYLKQQKELDLVPKLETRKANEGDDNIWKNATVVTKKDEDEDAYFIGKAKTSAPKQRAKKEEKVYLEIDARFERPQRGGRGRGGPGDRGRGGGGRGGGDGGRGRGPRGGRANGGNQQPVDVDDQAAFPSLS